MASRGSKIVGNTLKILGAVVGVAVIIAGVKLSSVVFPATPKSTPEMAFTGFIKLPGHGYLNILDYIKIDGRALFVTSESSGSVYRVDLSATDPSQSSALLELTGKPSAHGVAVTGDNGAAFVTRSEANTVELFDPASMTRLASIPVQDDADAILYDQAANLIYVANGDPKIATLIDPQKRAVAGTINLGGKPEFPVLDPQSGLVYQNLNDLNQVAAVDVAARAVVGKWSLAPCDGPTGLALDPANKRLFAVCGKSAQLVVFALDQHRVVATLPVGGGPDVVAFDLSNRRLYVAGKAGELTVVQQAGPDGYRVLANIKTHYGAHTLAVDPVSHKVYVGYASLLIGPRLAVFEPR